MPQATCGTCPFWAKKPIDPMNPGAPAVGECRWGPPQVIVLPTGPGRMQITPYYPQLDESFPCCGRHPQAPVSQPPSTILKG